MALNDNSYGSVAGVASLVPRFVNGDGEFSPETRPTEAGVEGLIDQISSILNMVLATAGFSVPVDQADCVRMLDFFVNQEVASVVEGVNGSGRFGPKTKGGSASRFSMIHSDAEEFIMANAIGLERLGADKHNDELEVGDFATNPVGRKDSYNDDSDTDYWYEVDLYGL